MTVKFSHDRKVRSLAKKTLGSTRVGRAIRLPILLISRLSPTKISFQNLVCEHTRRCLEERLA